MVDLALQRKRLAKLVSAATRPSCRRGLRHGVLAAVEHRPLLELLPPVAVVVDVGANIGQFALLAREVFPRARILSFEPLPGPRARLEKLFRDDGQHRCLPLALSDSSGSAQFHVTAAEDSSSLLPVTPRQVEEFPGTQNVETVTVDVARLDDVMAVQEPLAGPMLVKLDIQGTELDVLRGGVDVLERASHLVVELSFVELYAGQDTAAEVTDFLAARGWALRAVYDLKTSRRTSEPLQADFLFQMADVG